MVVGQGGEGHLRFRFGVEQKESFSEERGLESDVHSKIDVMERGRRRRRKSLFGNVHR